MKTLNELEDQDKNTKNSEDNLNAFNTRFKKIKLVFQNGQTLELPVKDVDLKIFGRGINSDDAIGNGNDVMIDENLKTIQAYELNLEINDQHNFVNNPNLANNRRISSIKLTSLNDHQTTINLPDESNYNQIIQLYNPITIKIKKKYPKPNMIKPFLILAIGGAIAMLLPYLLH